MTLPGSPAELIHKETEYRARGIFDEYDSFSPAMQRQARLLVRVALNDDLSDCTFRDLLAVSYLFWRECNQARFVASQEADGSITDTVRSVQVDQFLNGVIVGLNSIPNLSDDKYEVTDISELDGS